MMERGHTKRGELWPFNPRIAEEEPMGRGGTRFVEMRMPERGI